MSRRDVEVRVLSLAVFKSGAVTRTVLIGDFFQSNTQVIVKFTEIGGKNWKKFVKNRRNSKKLTEIYKNERFLKAFLQIPACLIEISAAEGWVKFQSKNKK